MKTFNLIVLALFIFMFGGMFLDALGTLETTEFWLFVAVIVGLLAIPASYLLAVRFDRGLRNAFALRRFALGYNVAASLFLAWHATTVDVVGAHPVAFAAAEKTWSFILAAFAALNAWKLATTRDGRGRVPSA